MLLKRTLAHTLRVWGIGRWSLGTRVLKTSVKINVVINQLNKHQDPPFESVRFDVQTNAALGSHTPIIQQPIK